MIATKEGFLQQLDHPHFSHVVDRLDGCLYSYWTSEEYTGFLLLEFTRDTEGLRTELAQRDVKVHRPAQFKRREKSGE